MHNSYPGQAYPTVACRQSPARWHWRGGDWDLEVFSGEQTCPIVANGEESMRGPMYRSVIEVCNGGHDGMYTVSWLHGERALTRFARERWTGLRQRLALGVSLRRLWQGL